MTRSIAALLALLVVATACGGKAEPFVGYARNPTPNVADVALPAVEADGSETEFAFRAQDDGILLVYFGYISCPDVCPTTLADVRRAVGALGDAGERTDLAMITIDTEVDTPEILTGYVRSFIPDAVAVRSVDDDRLRAAADAFGADYGKEEVDGEAKVFHTGSLYAVDPIGDLVLTWPFGTSSDDIRGDLERLLEEA